jgi:hypothetical protein
MNRRTFLRGAGTVAIALPFVDAMTISSAFAAPATPPPRLVTFFFGLGIPQEYTVNGFTGPLAPLGEFSEKLALLRGVDLAEADGSGNNHFDGGGGVFVGEEPAGEGQAGGPSIDQVAMQALHPNGSPTLIPTLMTGTWFRRSRPTRYVHSWRNDGTPVDIPTETPAELFTRIFGTDPGDATEGDAKARKYRSSVLDSVTKQYQYMNSERAGLGAATRNKISDHLDRVRELERRVAAEAEMTAAACSAPAGGPNSPALLRGQNPDDGSNLGPVLSPGDFERYWHLMTDLYVMALRCDLTRFGNAMLMSAGERFRFQGEYRFNGDLVADFDDAQASHEYWHAYRAENANNEMNAHLTFMADQMAYFLRQLDDSNYTEENGKSVLDNMTLLMGTELGNGSRHDLKSVFHAVSSGNGRFNVGNTMQVDTSAVDLYNTILRGHGVTQRMGNQAFFNGEIGGLLNDPDDPI